MALSLLCSVFGFIISYRIFLDSFLDFHFSEELKKKIFKILFSIFILLYLFESTSSILLWISALGVILMIKVSPMIMRFYLSKSLSESFLSIVDEIILNIRSGKSFRASLLNVTQSRSGLLRNLLFEIYHAVTSNHNPFSKTSKHHLKQFISDLKEIDASQTKALNQLSALRRNLKINYDLKRKLSLASQQADAQTAILTVLQVLLLIFVSAKFGFIENLQLILVSSFLFTIGIIGAFFIKRGFRWKT